MIEKLVRFTGLDAHYLEESNIRFDVSHFTRQLLRDSHETIGRYDGRLAGPSSMNAGETSEFDPSSTLITPPFVSMFTSYISNESCNYKTDMLYYYQRRRPTVGLRRPEWDSATPPSLLLRNAMGEEPVYESDDRGCVL